jgi:competence protein ComEA
MWQIQALARRKRLLLGAIVLILGTIILASALMGATNPPTPDAAITTPADDLGHAGDNLAPDEAATLDRPLGTNPTPAATIAIVYISGAVQHPDVYQVSSAARVKDVVLAAGGLTEDAATDRINLADHISDAQHIHIPSQAEPAPEPAAAGASATPGNQEKLLNINTASAADLDSLPGIGQSIAQRIVEYRTTNGPFQSAEDLRKVKGIGPALFANIAPLITAGP